MLERIRDMQYQLNESQEDGTLHEFIDTFDGDLNDLLAAMIRLLSAKKVADAA